MGKDPPEQRIGIFLEVGQARRFCEMVCMEQENVRTTEHRKLTNLISGTDQFSQLQQGDMNREPYFSLPGGPGPQL